MAQSGKTVESGESTQSKGVAGEQPLHLPERLQLTSAIDLELKSRLLESIESQRLVLFCGAGLSMAPPSSLPSAIAIANECFDRFKELGEVLDQALRDDLDAVARHFIDDGCLRPYFIDQLVPWNDFVSRPNAGHVAIADLLLCRALAATITTNYDGLVERCASDFGAFFEVAFDGDDANRTSTKHSPYVKLHGSITRPRETVWTSSQLGADPIRSKIESCRAWLAANLRQKDLVFIGFWSDWKYLNSLLEHVLTGIDARSVMIVSPGSTAALQAKAPALWDLISNSGAMFRHVQASGADFLEGVRVAFSEVFIMRALTAGCASYLKATGQEADPEWLGLPSLSSEELYALRRNVEGIPNSKPALARTPPSPEAFGHCHLLLMRAGATLQQTDYSLAGRRVRVINGWGRDLDTVKAAYAQQPPFEAVETVIAAGALDLGVHENLIRSGRAGDLVRPSASGDWLTLERAREQLVI